MIQRHLPFSLLCLLTLPFAAVADDADPDTSFSDEGRFAQRWPDTTIQAETSQVAIADDGSVVTASWSTYSGQPGGQAGSILLTRVRADGTMDPDFGADGNAVVDFNPAPRTFERPRAVAIDAGGRVLVAAGFELDEDESLEHAALARMHADGTPDTSFADGGQRVFTTSPWGLAAEMIVRDAVILPDGSAVFAFYCSGCDSDAINTVVLRSRPDGEPDMSFGDEGWAAISRPSGPIFPAAIAVAADGAVVVAGTGMENNVPDRPFVARLTAQGSIDAGFGDEGFALLPFDDFLSRAIAVGHDGGSPGQVRIFVSMDDFDVANPLAQIVGVTDAGEVDPDFGTAGVLDLSLEEGTRIGAMAVDELHRLLIAGTINPNGAGENDFLVVRSTFDGTMDASFDGNGKARYTFAPLGRYDTASAIALSPRHAVIAGTLYNNTLPEYHVAALRLKLRLNLVFGDGFGP